MLSGTLLLLSCASFPFAPAASARQVAVDSEALAGSYFAGHGFGGGTITLEAGGRYSQSYGSCTFGTEESGRFVLSDGVLRFRLSKYTGRYHGERKAYNLLDSRARRKFFHYDDGEDRPVERESELRVVTWGERTYLLDEDDIQNFANAINLGIEPRTSFISQPYFGQFYLREGDEAKAATGTPAMPAKWQALLLGEPVEATIVRVEQVGDERIAVVDKGRRDGLVEGMLLVYGAELPLPWSLQGKVLSVEESTAHVRIGDQSAGDMLSSRLRAGP